MRIPWRTYRPAMSRDHDGIARSAIGFLATLGTALMIAGCVPAPEPESYLGSWDPLFLSLQGSLQVFDMGLSFDEDEVCSLGFGVECHPATFKRVGDAISVTVDGEPDAYLLYTLCEGYLVIHQKGGDQLLYKRR